MSLSASSTYYPPLVFILYLPVSVVYHLYTLIYSKFFRLPPPIPGYYETLPGSELKNNKRIAIVTGSNTGVGYATARSLVMHGYTVILACRNRDKAIQAEKQINLEVAKKEAHSGHGIAIFEHPLDTSDIDSVHEFVDVIKKKYKVIHVLVNNAGINSSGRISRKDDKDWDLLYCTNFVGHFVLTGALMPLLLKAGDDEIDGKKEKRPARIVTLSSVMHHFCGPSMTEGSKNPHPMDSIEFWKSCIYADTASDSTTYQLSKLSSVLFTQQLMKRYGTNGKIEAVATNPGAVASDIWRTLPSFIQSLFKILMLDASEGCQPSVAAVVDESLFTQKKTDGGSSLSEVMYLQPYWKPSHPYSNWLCPIYEMSGPYQGVVQRKPRLPTSDNGLKMSNAMWDATVQVTKTQNLWPKE